MICELDQGFGAVVRQLSASIGADEPFVFTRDRLPKPEALLATDRLVIKRGSHIYDGCHREDALTIYFASHSTARALGVLALAVLFHPEPATVELRLVSPHSDIKRLRVRYEHGAESAHYFAAPSLLRYWPGEVRRHPWPWLRSDSFDLPELRLTSADELGPNGSWDERHTVVGFGSERATVRFAELLLDLGVEGNAQECDLESDAGFGGLAPLSAEVRLILPGAEIWSPEYFASSGPHL